MKKFLVVALSALLLLALFIPALAEDAPKFTTTVSATKVQPGDEFTLTLVADKGYNTKGFGLDFSAINALGLFEIVEVYDEEEEEMVLGIWDKKITKKAELINFNGNQGVFTYKSARDIAEGEIITVKYKVKAGAAFGQYEMKILLNDLAPAGYTLQGSTIEIYHDCAAANSYTTDKDATHHWSACTVCGAEKDGSKVAHSGGSATCENLANCTVCGQAYGDYASHVPAADSVQVAPATCSTAAIHKTVCDVCGDQIGETFEVGTPDASLHVGGTATCIKKAVCTACSQEYGSVDANNHASTTPKKDATQHWDECDACHNVVGIKVAHSGGTATCKDKAVCTTCGEAYGEVDLTKHTGGTATCTEKAVCTVCSQKYGSVDANNHVSTTLKKDATQHWDECDACHNVVGIKVAHSGGTATCKDKAVCTTCGEAYGEVDLTKHTGGTATCTDKAVCTVCSQPYGSVNANNHVSTTLKKDATQHWNECDDCHNVVGIKVAHSGGSATCKDKAVCTTCGEAYGEVDLTKHTGGTATCTDKAVCTVCSQPYGSVNANNHVSTTLKKDATQHWNECDDCHNVVGIKVAHSGGTATCKDKAVCTTCGEAYGEVDLTKHTGGTATCTDKAVCTVCSQPYGSVNADNHGTTTLKKNETQHWNECDKCHNVVGTKTAHSGGKADCKNKAVCEICAQAYGSTNPAVHTGNEIVTPAEPATCEKAGKTAETSCKDCGVVLVPSTPIEKLAHKVKKWTVVVPATETTEGEKTGKCEACGNDCTVAIPKLSASMKAENILDVNGEKANGVKVEGVGETKLPAEVLATIMDLTAEQVEKWANEEEIKEVLASEPDAAGKEVIDVIIYGFSEAEEYTDKLNGDKIENGADYQLPGKVKVTIPLAVDVSGYENLIVFAEGADMKLDKVDAKIENGVIVFETEDDYNGVIIMGTPKKVADPNVPQNGDDSNVALFATLAFISLIALGASTVSKKSKASK